MNQTNQRDQRDQTDQRKDQFEDEIELIDYLRVLWKWRWLIIGGTLLCILAVAIYGLTRPVVRMYKVSALIEIDPKAKLDPLDRIKSMIEYGIFNQQILNDLSNLQGISKPESLSFEVAIPKGLNILDIAYETANVDLGKAVLNSLIKQLEQEYIQQTRYQFYRNLDEINTLIAWIETLNKEIRLIKGRIDQIKNVLQEVQSSSDKLSAKREAALLDSTDKADDINVFVYAAAIKQVIDYPLVLRERIDRLISEKNSISAQIISEINIIKDLAVRIKSLKIVGETNVGDEENFILKVKSEIERLKRDRDKIKGVILKQPPTASLIPIKYKAKRNALLAGVVSFFFLIFLAFFIEYIKNASKPTQKAV